MSRGRCKIFGLQVEDCSMHKRTAPELLTTSKTDGQAFKKAQGNGTKRETVAEDERGEFEDAWEDEIESDDDVINAAEDEDGAPDLSLC